MLTCVSAEYFITIHIHEKLRIYYDRNFNIS